MKTFHHNKTPTFLAMMVFGWMACNVVWWLLEFERRNWYYWRDVPKEMIFVGVATWIVILFAWMLIFHPVAAAIPATSKWRKPGMAALLGLLEASALLLVQLTLGCWQMIAEGGLSKMVRYDWGERDLSYALGALATGTVAGWTHALMEKPAGGQRP